MMSHTASQVLPGLQGAKRPLLPEPGHRVLVPLARTSAWRPRCAVC